MIINYVSSAMEKTDFEKLFANSNRIPGQQAQKFNRLMIEGLGANGQTVYAISGRPVTSGNCKSKWLPCTTTRQNENVLYVYNAVLNLPVIKNVGQIIETFFRVLATSKKEGQAVVMDVLNASVAYGAVLAARVKKIPCIGIVTDLPQLMVTGTNDRHIKMVNRIIENCTGYVFLTEAMNDELNPKRKPYVIIEGLCDNVPTADYDEEKEEKRTIAMYAGLLDARYGVKNMVDAFIVAGVPDAELHIYGDGPNAEELKSITKKHHNIIYCGVVMNDQIVEAERKADILINPRPTHEEFTKYSFPSKNMEYMASGTPVLTTNLPGMPREYLDYIYVFHGESVDAMGSDFKEVLLKDKREREPLGQKAKRFVLEKKNKKIQTEKILTLLKRR